MLYCVYIVIQRGVLCVLLPLTSRKLLYFEWSPPWRMIWNFSDISSGSKCGIYFLTFYYGSLSGIYSDILSGILSGTFYLASIVTLIMVSILPFYLAFHPIFYSGILSGIYSDILFCLSIWQSFWHSYWHSIWRSILEFYLASNLDILSDMGSAGP